jgi:hypothetical protein
MRAAMAWLALASAAIPAAAGTSQITREEALRLAFPGATIRAEQVFLTGDQQKRAAAAAGAEIGSALIARYIATRGGAVQGRAYVDTHVIRSKKESLLVSLDATGHVRRVDVTAFLEPPEYEPPAAWVDQYDGRRLGDDLQINRAIRPMAGATLTAAAVNKAVRRVLAIDRVLSADEQGQ